MKIRLLQYDDTSFWIQQPKRIFGKTYWITLRNKKTFFRTLLYYSIGYTIFPFIIYGFGSLFSPEINFLDESLNLLFSSYIYSSILWAILFSSHNAKIKEFFRISRLDDPNIFPIITFKYKGKDEIIEVKYLVKSSKRTIFGKIKVVYYMNKKDLRRQKLEKLKSSLF